MLGSEHWVVHPTYALQQLKLVINVDMIGRMRDDRVTVYGARTAAGLRGLASFSNADTRLSLNFDAIQREDSDHWTFYRRRIPYLMFHTGDHEDYHRPSDDADKLNYDGLERLARLIFAATHTAAHHPTLPEFRVDVVHERPTTVDETRRHEPPRLGISWNADRAPGEPFVIARVVDNSPAARAGLRPGDRIVAFNGQSSAGIDDLAQVVLAAPDDSILLVQREIENAPRRVPVRLNGSPVRLGVRWRTDPSEPGFVIVTSVAAGSPAQAAGIAVGDRLGSPDSPVVASSGEWLRDATASTRDGDRLDLLLERHGIVQSISVDLLPEPSAGSLQLAD